MRKFAVALMLFFGMMISQAYANPIVTNKVIVEKKPDTYMEVRYIVLRGTNEEIGEAIATIGKEWLDIKLSRYSAPMYAKARRHYMKLNYPILYERMKGVAKAFGIPFDGNIYDTSAMPYDMGPLACSSLYFPPDSTTSGHALMARNNDFYTTTARELMGQKPVAGEYKLYSQNFVMEVYPDKGYPSLMVGTFDLLNAVDGMNSKGLVVEMLADQQGARSNDPFGGGTRTGLMVLQVVRLLLDTCATAEEAKIKILSNEFTFSAFEATHLQVGDRFGNAFIVEISGKDRSIHFTDNKGKPQIITNHAVYLYPNVKTFPPVPPRATYNTFYRYRVLHDFLQNHRGKFSIKDAWKSMSLVYGHTTDVDEGASLPTPVRTLWTVLYDLDSLDMQVQFYLKDGKKDPGTGDPTLIFTKLFKFKLKVKK